MLFVLLATTVRHRSKVADGAAGSGHPQNFVRPCVVGRRAHHTAEHVAHDVSYLLSLQGHNRAYLRERIGGILSIGTPVSSRDPSHQ
jgi:hypothetical protein